MHQSIMIYEFLITQYCHIFPLQWMAFTSLGVVLVSTMTFVLGTFPGIQYSDYITDPDVQLSHLIVCST